MLRANINRPATSWMYMFLDGCEGIGCVAGLEQVFVNSSIWKQVLGSVVEAKDVLSWTLHALRSASQVVEVTNGRIRGRSKGWQTNKLSVSQRAPGTIVVGVVTRPDGEHSKLASTRWC